jgi:predicted RNA-binding Zn-ribbon protein involved in translation (DUF1610 family)
MITSRDTTVGYHCPFCGMPILNRINIFSMEGNLIKLKCVCGGSELAVQILKGHKYKITAPCILCPDPHSYTLSSAAFFQKDLFALACKFTAVDICFIGKSNKVYEALKKNAEELIQTFAALDDELGNLGDLADEYFDDDFGDEFYDDDDEFYEVFEEEKELGFILHKNENFKPMPAETAKYDIDDIKSIKINSYQASAHVLNIISRMYAQKKISCKCKNFDGALAILDKIIRVECKSCGSYRDIKASSLSDAQYLGELDRLYLDFED